MTEIEETWFYDLLADRKHDPAFLTEQVLIDVTEQISARLRELDMRSSDLAERLGVSRAYVSQLLNGKPNMTMRTLVGAAHALGLRVHVELRERPAIDNAAEGVRSTTALSSER